MKSYTLDEVARSNGEQGSEGTLVAVDGKVYDLSGSKRWAGGVHMRRHRAGADLSSDIKAAPHSPDVLGRFPLVGVIEEKTKEPQPGLKGRVDAWLDDHPFFRRHPHPALVHIPVGCGAAAAVFHVIGVLLGSPALATAAFRCLALVLVVLPPTLATGYFTWWMNYDCTDSRLIKFKRRLAWGAVGLAGVAVITRIFVQDPLDLSNRLSLMYTAALLGFSGIVSVVGFLGGLLIFPFEASPAKRHKDRAEVAPDISVPETRLSPWQDRKDLVARLKLYLGLSRTTHGVLDLATPALAALLWLGGFPPLFTIALGLVTAFAGYTAVYALNDLIDYRVDKERLAKKDDSTAIFHIDEIFIPHPIAQGALPFNKGLLWFAGWAATALVGAYLLNPVCALLFVVSAAMEGLYCRLLQITHFKIIPSIIVKATGGLAGVLAVDPHPSSGFLAVLFIWIAAWETGGQNVPNDIVDREDDKRVSAKTTATVLDSPDVLFILITAVGIAFASGIGIYWAAGQGIGMLYPIGAACLGWFLLLDPARAVYRDPAPAAAASLFNRAGYMPPLFLVLTVLSMLTP
ncbi:MAG: UbiA family prenyltransferase [Pseudomonadota bacterium]